MSAPDDRKKKRRSGGFTRDDAVEEMTFEDTDISSKRGPAAAASDMDDSQVDEDLEYDDLHEDELEAEDIAETSDAEDDEHLGTIEEAQAKIAAAEAIENSSQPVQRVWRPGVDTMEPDEKLEYEASAYTMMHNIQVEWPCLSVDLLRDSLGEFRTKFPHTMYVAAGSQADRANKNKVSLLKLSDLSRNKQSESDSESDSDSEDATDDDPVIEERSFAHNGGVNRIRACPQKPHILATFSELGRVHLWDAEPYLKALDAPPTGKLPKNPELMSMQHSTEGFALDWSPVSAGRLASGDCNHQLYLWQPHQATWRVDKQNFRGHTDSIEDIQWSPNETDVFMTCSVDQSIRVWDCRAPQQAALAVAGAHDCDINVISWNRKAPHLLVSGADDGSFKIWDLKNFRADAPVAHFKWHRAQITGVQWHPHEESTLAVASADDSISIWDMSLEPDNEVPAVGAELEDDIPPQLLFVHQGQQEVKEVHFHPQISSMLFSTASDGFNVFQPSNL